VIRWVLVRRVLIRPRSARAIGALTVSVGVSSCAKPVRIASQPGAVARSAAIVCTRWRAPGRVVLDIPSDGVNGPLTAGEDKDARGTGWRAALSRDLDIDRCDPRSKSSPAATSSRFSHKPTSNPPIEIVVVDGPLKGFGAVVIAEPE
jgi:hypothetical protein